MLDICNVNEVLDGFIYILEESGLRKKFENRIYFEDKKYISLKAYVREAVHKTVLRKNTEFVKILVSGAFIWSNAEYSEWDALDKCWRQFLRSNAVVDFKSSINTASAYRSLW